MQMHSTMVGAALTVALVLTASGCEAAPASREQLAETEQRMLAPFLSGTEVGCNELLVEMTGNFNTFVSQPALDPQVHTMRHESGENYIDRVWTNTLGRPQSAFLVTVGEPTAITETGLVTGPRTTFTVVNQVRLRVFQGRHPVTLKATARGERVVVREAGLARHHDVREFVVEDGVLKAP